MVGGGVAVASVRVGEPAVADAARRTGERDEVADERNPERGLPQGLAEFGDDLGGSVLQAIEDAQHPG